LLLPWGRVFKGVSLLYKVAKKSQLTTAKKRALRPVKAIRE
jgi:hypothetical protein